MRLGAQSPVQQTPVKSSRGAGTPRRVTNPRTGGGPARGTAGTNPRTGQAAVISNTVGTHEFILDFGSCVSEVECGSGTMVWGLVFRCWTQLYGFSHTYLSSAPLHRSRLLSTSSPWAPFQLQNQ